MEKKLTTETIKQKSPAEMSIRRIRMLVEAMSPGLIASLKDSKTKPTGNALSISEILGELDNLEGIIKGKDNETLLQDLKLEREGV